MPMANSQKLTAKGQQPIAIVIVTISLRNTNSVLPQPSVNLSELFLLRQVRIYPADVESHAFHAAEPGHLPFGELVDGGVELRDHIAVVQFAYKILGDKLIL